VTAHRFPARRILAALIYGSSLLSLAWPAGAQGPRLSSPAESGAPSVEAIRAGIERGVAFLLRDQNPQGSWGGPRGAVWTFTGAVWSNPETHRCWKVATTGLACLALLETDAGDAARAAADRAVDYLLDHAAVRRPSEWDTMNSWAYIYGLQALAAAYLHPRYAGSARHERMRAVACELIAGLERSQTPAGGWGYLEFDPPRTRRPQWATSFTTAAGIIALAEAQRAGLTVDPEMVTRAVRGVQRCRLPSGAYTYSIQALADPRHSEWIDQIKGSLGRIQVCHAALCMAGQPVPVERLRQGLEHFFREHRFLDIARNRPIPHEAYYYNSGYFYLFGHYYAARVIEQMPADEQAGLWPKLAQEVLKIQQSDGSMWDYDMHAYHKPYGTAFGLMVLQRAMGNAGRGS